MISTSSSSRYYIIRIYNLRERERESRAVRAENVAKKVAREALKEAMTIQFGRSLRHFFVTMASNGMIGDPKAMWEEFKDELSEDRDERPPDAKATESMINKAFWQPIT